MRHKASLTSSHPTPEHGRIWREEATGKHSVQPRASPQRSFTRPRTACSPPGHVPGSELARFSRTTRAFDDDSHGALHIYHHHQPFSYLCVICLCYKPEGPEPNHGFSPVISWQEDVRNVPHLWRTRTPNAVERHASYADGPTLMQ